MTFTQNEHLSALNVSSELAKMNLKELGFKKSNNYYFLECFKAFLHMVHFIIVPFPPPLNLDKVQGSNARGPHNI
jgi:hypothetical protein